MEKRAYWVRWAAGAALVIVVAAIVLLFRAWPFKEETIRQALEEASAQTVEIGSFRKTYFPPGCLAENLTFRGKHSRASTPLITVQKLTISSSYAALATLSNRIDQVRVMGMRLTIPPRRHKGQPAVSIPLAEGSGKPVRIRTLIADGTLLEVLPDEPDEDPYRLQIVKLVLKDIGSGAPMAYRTTLVNSTPPGDIQSEGKFGPWAPAEPGSTPVSGTFTFSKARLNVFKDISGTLTSTGKFSGRLDRIEVQGSAVTPDFQVSGANHKVDLKTAYQATVNATNGDTLLHQVKSHFGRTTIVSDGGVTGHANQKGKTASLTMSARDGRIEDLLWLFNSAKKPAMTGAVSLKTRVELPPGPRKFLEKLKLTGDFGIAGGSFNATATQDTIDKLSKSAAGEHKKEAEEDPRTMLSDLKGHVALANGRATLSNVSFRVSGAEANIKGTYGMLDQVIALHGVLETSGKLSDTQSGFNSFLLKVITPFFKKDASVRIFPFSITGTYDNPSVGIDWKGGHRSHAPAE